MSRAQKKARGPPMLPGGMMPPMMPQMFGGPMTPQMNGVTKSSILSISD